MTDLAPLSADPMLDGDHERQAHIVFEGGETDDGETFTTGNCVVDGLINGTPVTALCGKRWVPTRDPRKYPVCETCKEIAAGMGWGVPNG